MMGPGGNRDTGSTFFICLEISEFAMLRIYDLIGVIPSRNFYYISEETSQA